MTEGCSSQKNQTKLTGTQTGKLIKLRKNNGKHYHKLFYQNLYCKRSKTPAYAPKKSNRGSCKSEVKLLEWLVLHLNLLQQNCEIAGKERTISMLEQENEMLREHINCLQRGIRYSFRNPIKTILCGNAAHIKDDKSLIFGCGTPEDTMNTCIKSCDLVTYNSVINRRIQASCDIDSEVATNTDDKCTLRNPLVINRNTNDIDVNNYQDELSIKRDRLCSGSSAFSNNTSIGVPHSSRKRQKKHTNRRIIKDDQILRCPEPYVTQSSDLALPREEQIPSASNLEVPSWRVRVYSSLYIMEGTENLDDDIFDKRHMKHEHDERRRKRWDVQRIREQRVIEKLKLRQARISGNNTTDNAKPVTTLWPTAEDIKFVEVADELPVSAFGVPVPQIPPSDFSLPWLTNCVEPTIEEPEPPMPLIEDEPATVKKSKPSKRSRKRRRGNKR